MISGVGLERVEMGFSKVTQENIYKVTFELVDGSDRGPTNNGIISVEVPWSGTPEDQVIPKAREILHEALQRLAGVAKSGTPS